MDGRILDWGDCRLGPRLRKPHMTKYETGR